MKKPFVLFLIIITCFIACKKENSIQSKPASIAAAKTSAIKIGEPVSFTLNNAIDSVHWSVNPSANVHINQSGNKASIIFPNSGSYVVNAFSGSVFDSIHVIVNDSLYNGGGLDSLGGGGDTSISFTTVPLTGDQITLAFTVADLDSINHTTSGLFFSATTKNNYNCLNNTLLYDLNGSGNDYTINFTGVKFPNGNYCSAGNAQSYGYGGMYPIDEGSHGLTITLNGVNYTGSFVKSGNTYTFTWSYSSGVLIPNLVVK